LSSSYVSWSDTDSNKNAGTTGSPLDDRYYNKNENCDTSSLCAEKKNQNWMGFILFVVHVMIVLVLAIIYIPPVIRQQLDSNPNDTDDDF
jgi:hypothetical protein